ncbi:mas-related G-protein coupled receptor member H-like [Eublepharis macularius]|uniref:Mas-related G-protein coupled receptor member H-like n=1 Tax=Eublepharis macularius TaxID=481883 RepID=A0AA97L436_EUBMA|nr:mas-related G-protein coupled receptor member H-like [Eublepharis macularius]
MMDAALKYYNNPNYTWFPNDNINYDYVSEDISFHHTSDYGSGRMPYNNFLNITFISILVICIFGVVGNGIVIWLLGFHIKRNPFTTYILNLAIADFGRLLSLIFAIVSNWLTILYDLSSILSVSSIFLFLSTHTASNFLLTAISIDSCMAAFFPLWHRCHRPPHLSTIVCVLVWVLSFLLSRISFIILQMYNNEAVIRVLYQFIVNAMVCFPLVAAATLALFINVCCKAQQHQRRKLFTIILLTLLCFLFLGSPLNIIVTLHFYIYILSYVVLLAFVLSCLNSSVNPMIYFLVGRERKARHRESLEVILQRVFKEEEGCAEELQPPVQIQL